MVDDYYSSTSGKTLMCEENFLRKSCYEKNFRHSFLLSTLDLFIETPEVKSTPFHCVDMKATQDHESAA